MQRELDALRRQIREKNQRIQRLESDVSLLRSRDARNAQPLEETMQKVETELEETSVSINRLVFWYKLLTKSDSELMKN